MNIQKSLTKIRSVQYFKSEINYLEKRFTQMYKALYGNAMLVSLMAAGRQQEHLFSSFSTNA